MTTIPAVASDVRLHAYRHPKNESVRIFNQLYLDGVKAGLMSYNAVLKRRGAPLAFCIPDTLALSTERIEEVMLKSAEKRGAADDALVAPLLLSGLHDEFPCDTPAMPPATDAR